MAATGVIGTPAAAEDRQPRALPTIFFTEMWERFSYYGMRALLVLYLVNALGYERGHALAVYGLYTGLVYLSPLAGGWLADRYLGTRKAVLVGGITMALGHFAMAFEPLLYLALGLLVAGNGFFKPNMATLLGSLYRENDPRRDGGFTIYYMGVNLGAFFSPLVAGTLGERVGWHYGFASAGVGMCLGIAQFLWGQERLGDAGMRDGKTRLDARDWLHVVVLSAAMIPLVYLVMAAWGFVGPVWDALPGLAKAAIVAAIVAVLWFAGHARSKRHVEAGHEPLTREEWQRIVAILVMGFFVIFFWMGFEQAGGSMNLFADKQTDRHLGSFEIPSTWFQSINPLLIFLLAPFFSMMWTAINKSRFSLPDVAKQGLGMIVLGLGFVVMFIAQNRANQFGPVGPQWLFWVYALHTIGELMLSPVGLSLVSRAAPHRIAGLLMGVWFIANGVANYFAGALEGLLAGSGIPPYAFLLASSIGMGVLLLLLTPILHRMLARRDVSTTA